MSLPNTRPEQRPVQSLRLMTYNILAPVPRQLVETSQEQRMDRIADAVVARPYPWPQGVPPDVVCVQESCIDNLHKRLSDGFKRHGYVYAVDPYLGAPSRFHLVGSGLGVFSKFPLSHPRHLTFDEDFVLGADALAPKGALYVRVHTPSGLVVHVVTVHAQAWHTEEARWCRLQQAVQLKQFIDDLHVPTSEPLVVCGDFNVDTHTQSACWERYWLGPCGLGLVACLPPKVASALTHGHLSANNDTTDNTDSRRQAVQAESGWPSPLYSRFSIDPKHNSMVGMDGGCKESLSHAFPQGCRDHYKQTHTCVCCPPLHCDVVLVSRQHRPLPSLAYSAVSPVRAVEGYVPKWKVPSIRGQYHELSDHYPVVAYLEWTVPTYTRPQHTTHLPRQQRPVAGDTVDGQRAHRTLRRAAWGLLITGVCLGALIAVWVATRNKKR